MITECAEGAVVGVRDGEPLVKTGDSVIALASYELRHEGRKKLRIGDRLGLSAQAAQAMLLQRQR